MKILFAIEERIVRAEKGAAILFLFLIILFSFLQIVMRSVFSSGFMWADPLVRHSVLWAGMAGAALASRYSKQFAFEAGVKLLPPKLRGPAETAVCVFTVAASAILFYAAMKFIKDEYAAEAVAFSIGSVKMRSWLIESVIPAAFLAAAFHAVLGIFRKE